MTTMDLKPKRLYSNWNDKELMTFERRDSAHTGIKKIDENFCFPSGFYIIAGSPGSGKGWLATWMSRQFYSYDLLRSVYFSLEMSETLIRTRILQQWSGLTKKQLENGGDVSLAVSILSKDVLIVDDFHSEETKLQTPQVFENEVRFYYSLGYRVFHFDHLHEIGGMNDNNQNQFISESWGKMFQKLSKELKNIWLFVYVQPSGKGYDKQILKRQDISGSKSIIQKCDYFLSINREQDELLKQQRDVYLYIDKNRYSDINHVAFKLYFSETGNFFEVFNNDKQ